MTNSLSLEKTFLAHIMSFKLWPGQGAPYYWGGNVLCF